MYFRNIPKAIFLLTPWIPLCKSREIDGSAVPAEVKL